VSQLLSLLALGFAVAGGIHREAVAWLCRSVVDMPPGSPISITDLASRVVGQAAGSISLAIHLAFPVLAAVTIGHLSLGLLNRTTRNSASPTSDSRWRCWRVSGRSTWPLRPPQ